MAEVVIKWKNPILPILAAASLSAHADVTWQVLGTDTDGTTSSIATEKTVAGGDVKTMLRAVTSSQHVLTMAISISISDCRRGLGYIRLFDVVSLKPLGKLEFVMGDGSRNAGIASAVCQR